MADTAGARGEFLDQVALAAQELGRRDQADLLERAWRAAPSLVRLCRWLGTAKSAREVKKRAASALKACPKGAGRQRAVLHALLGHLESAARLLAASPGLGWSDEEHPGHVVFGLLLCLLGGRVIALPIDAPSNTGFGADDEADLDIDELEEAGRSKEEASLMTPEIDAIIKLADVKRPTSTKIRTAILMALRRTAENRVAGVTEKKRRRHYVHAACLVAACATIGPASQTAAWVAGIRASYRRYPALQSEFDACLRRA